MNALASRRFWKKFDDLPEDLQKIAKKQFALWQENHSHPSLEFKNVGGSLWSARITEGCRALGRVVDADTIRWHWIGSHDEYERLIRQE